MANEEQLKILKQAYGVWNSWRIGHPDEYVDLRGAQLQGVDLRGLNLQSVDLRRANLKGGHLQGAQLQGANLQGANLQGAQLQDANLQDVDLRFTTLIMTNLTEAVLTGVKLYGTARDDWKIDNVKCDYVYWDEWGQQHVPKDRNFEPGEFEVLYKKLPTFEYYFEQSFTPLDPLIMDRVVQAINDRQPEIELKIATFDARGQAHATFTVLHKDYAEDTLKEITAGYEKKLAKLEGKREQLFELFTTLTDKPQYAITGEKVIMGDEITKTAGRDLFENVTNSHVTTGESFHDNAQKLIQAATPQAPQQDILNVLSFIQEELPKLALPEEVKEEIEHEVKGAEIQAKKPDPDKKKLADRLKNAVIALKVAGELGHEAVIIGQLLGKAILWCGEQITDFL